MESLQKFKRRYINYSFYILSPFILLLLIAVFFHYRGYIINISPSVPLGIYEKIEINDDKLEVDDYVLLQVPKHLEDFLFGRKYLNKDGITTNLIKKVAGIKGDTFEVKKNEFGKNILIKNQDVYLGIVSSYDSKKRELPHINKLTLGDKEYFLMGETLNSLDSRYYGSINRKDIICKLKPVFTSK